jgi:DNA primase
MDVKVAALADGEDPDSFIQKYGAEDFKRYVSQAKSLVEFKLERLKLEFDATTIEGRGAILREMLTTIEKVKNESVKSEYLKYLRLELNVNEYEIDLERNNILKKRPAASARTDMEAPRPALSAVLSSDEEWLLRFVMADDQWLKKAKEQIAPEVLGDTARQVLGVAYRLLDEGRDAGPAALVQEFLDEGLRRKLMAMASSPEGFDQKTAARAFDDCVKRIRDRDRKAQRQKLRESIRQAEKTGDHVALLKAQEEFNQLLRG